MSLNLVPAQVLITDDVKTATMMEQQLADIIIEKGRAIKNRFGLPQVDETESKPDSTRAWNLSNLQVRGLRERGLEMALSFAAQYPTHEDSKKILTLAEKFARYIGEGTIPPLPGSE
jgi:hypothetical protein